MSIKGAGGRARSAGRNPGANEPNGGSIVASGFPGPSKRRMRRPAPTNLRDEVGTTVYATPKAMKIA